MECTDTVNEEVFKISLIFGVIFAINYLIAGSVITYIGKKLLLSIILVHQLTIFYVHTIFYVFSNNAEHKWGGRMCDIFHGGLHVDNGGYSNIR